MARTTIVPLTPEEVRRAKKLGVITITAETERGYYVTCLRLRGSKEPARLSQGPERARYRTAARDQVRLVRAALADLG
jgi:hypothetical protein